MSISDPRPLVACYYTRLDSDWPANADHSMRSCPAVFVDEDDTTSDVPENDDFMVPDHWPVQAAQWLAQHARFQGHIPARLKSVGASHIPAWLWRHVADQTAVRALPRPERYTRESSAWQIFHRIAGFLSYWGWKNQYFPNSQTARIFYQELYHSLEHRKASPGPSIWRHAGLFWAYGIDEDGPGGVIAEAATGLITPADSSWEIPPLCDAALHSSPPPEQTLAADANIAQRLDDYCRKDLDILARTTGTQLLMRHVTRLARFAARAGGRSPIAVLAASADGQPLIEAARTDGIPDALIAQALQDPAGTIAHLARIIPPPQPDNPLNDNRSSDVHATIAIRHRQMERLLTEDTALWHELVDRTWRQPGLSWDFIDHRHDWITREWDAIGQYGPMTAPAVDIDLESFMDTNSQIDLDGLCHTVRLWTIALDIAVSASQHKNDNDARISHHWRPIALNPCNMAAVTLRRGVSLHSPQGIDLAASLYSLICATSTSTSLDLAQQCGAYPAFPVEEPAIARIIAQRTDAARKIPDNDIAARAKILWPEIEQNFAAFGLRNAFNIAPSARTTGTGPLEAASTGIQPLASLLIDYPDSMGGWLCRIRPAVPACLHYLGYDPADIEQILKHVLGHHSLHQSPGINHEKLAEKGFSPEMLARIEQQITAFSDLRSLVHPATLGSDCFRHDVGIPPELFADPGFDIFHYLGFSDAEITASTRYCYGTRDLSTAPLLYEDHRHLFRTGLEQHEDILCHLRLMAAIQPFSGPDTSQPVIVPEQTTQGQMAEYVLLGWQIGLSGLHLWRTGASLSAPWHGTFLPPHVRTETFPDSSVPATANNVTASAVRGEAPAIRQHAPLPDRRKGYTQKAVIGGHKLYLRTGEYQDGRLGEIFIDMHKEGAPFRSLVNNFAIAVSKGLQYGVPLEEFVEAFTFTRFDPSGSVEGNAQITRATSILDYVFRELAVSYLGRDDMAHAVPEDLRMDALGPGDHQARLPERPHFGFGLEEQAPDTNDDRRAVALSMGHFDSPCPHCQHYTLRPSQQEQDDFLECASCGHRIRIDFSAQA